MIPHRNISRGWCLRSSVRPYNQDSLGAKATDMRVYGLFWRDTECENNHRPKGKLWEQDLRPPGIEILNTPSGFLLCDVIPALFSIDPANG